VLFSKWVRHEVVATTSISTRAPLTDLRHHEYSTY
jgi:hypothetical protein